MTFKQAAERYIDEWQYKYSWVPFYTAIRKKAILDFAEFLDDWQKTYDEHNPNTAQ